MGNKSFGKGFHVGKEEGFEEGFFSGMEKANKDKLKNTIIDITAGTLIGSGLATLWNENKQKKSIDMDSICPKCGNSLISYISKKGKLKYICSRCGSKFKV